MAICFMRCICIRLKGMRLNKRDAIKFFAYMLSGALALSVSSQEAPIQRLSGGIIKSFPRTYRVTTTFTFPGPTKFSLTPGTSWKLRMVIPVPSSDEVHSVTNLKVGKGSLNSFDDGFDRFVAIDLDSPPSDFSIGYDITTYEYRADLSGLSDIPPYDESSALFQTYTRRTSGQIDPSHPKVLENARKLRAANKGRLEYIRAAYDFVYADMPYSRIEYSCIDDMYSKGKDGHPTGDCGAHAVYFCSLLRAQKIPARIKSGGVIEGKNEWAYHMWAEYYVEGRGWVPCDPTFGGSFYNRSGADAIYLNRGELKETKIGDWAVRVENGLQSYSYSHYYSGEKPKGDFSIQQTIKVELLSDSDPGAYYLEPSRVAKMREDITLGISATLSSMGKGSTSRPAELDAAATALLQKPSADFAATLRKAGFSPTGGRAAYSFTSTLIPGEAAAELALAQLRSDGVIDRYLSMGSIGIAYSIEGYNHKFYFISSGGKVSGKPAITLPTVSYGPKDAIPFDLSMSGTLPDKRDWIGIYEAEQVPDGDPPAIWWAYLADLGLSSGGKAIFDPTSISSERKARYLAGKKYKFVLAYFDGYGIEAEARFTLK